PVVLSGYGLGNYVDPSHKFVTHGHDGGLDGFLSHYAYLPNQGVGYFFSINTSSPGAGLKEIDDLIFGYLTRSIADPLNSPETEMPSDIGQWVGFYEPAAPRQAKAQFVDLLLGGESVYLRGGRLYRKSIF